MNDVIHWLNDSKYIEPLSPACKLCAEGAKLVLLVTGRCQMHCFYCPLSRKKIGKDVVYADEWKLDDEHDTDKIVREAEYIEAKGAGLTGGDPLLAWERTKHYITILKEHFGEKFHIHLYTSGLENTNHIQDLVSAGLDEIRFHPAPESWNNMENSPVKKAIYAALDEDVDVAIEIPSIPHMEREIYSLIEWAAEQGLKWININELEFSETNAFQLMKRGFDVKNEISAAVEGSQETANDVIKSVAERSLGIGVHYCSSSFKDGIQLRNRIKRRAKNVAKPYETITEEGTLLKGIILSRLPAIQAMEKIKHQFGIPDNLISFDEEKDRIEIAGWILEEIYSELNTGEFECYIVEEYPTADRLEVERIPLSF